MSSKYPWGTFVINVTGSYIIGFFLVLVSEQVTIDQHWRLAVAVGFVGAYTTFSTFEYEVLKLVEEDHISTGLLYVVASLLVGFLAVWGGAITARQVGAKAVNSYRAYRAISTVSSTASLNQKIEDEERSVKTITKP